MLPLCHVCDSHGVSAISHLQGVITLQLNIQIGQIIHLPDVLVLSLGQIIHSPDVLVLSLLRLSPLLLIPMTNPGD